MANSRRRSCDACYKRKIRCVPSDTEGLCDWCAHHKSACVFSRRKQRASPKHHGGDSADKLAKRLEAVENELQRVKASRQTFANPSPPITNLPTPQSTCPADGAKDSRHCKACQAQCATAKTSTGPNSALLSQIFFAGHNFGILCAKTSIPHFSARCEEYIHAQTGEWPRFQFPPVRQPKPSWVSLSVSSLSEMPERWVTDSLFEDYIRSDLYLVFPVVDPILFRETVNLAYSTSDMVSVDIISAKASVFAFLAQASARLPSNRASPLIDIERYTKKAQVMIAEFFEDATLTTLQTFISLLLLQTNSGRMQACVMYHTLASRTVLTLGGHLTKFPVVSGRPYTIPEREDRHLRILFFLCYFLDQDIALRSGQPPVMNDQFCDLTLPDGWAESRLVSRHRDPDNDDQMPCLPGDLRLCMLKSKVVEQLYANASMAKSDAEVLRTIRELDEELEEWRRSLPTEYSPALSIKKGNKMSDDLTASASMLHIELHLEYHHLLNAIHCASGRCTTPGNGDGGPINYGVQSSLDVSVEASRSTLHYLATASNRIACEAFWVFIFYPISALMTLFFSILRNPESEHAIDDVELLAMSSRIIHSMPIQKMNQADTEKLQQVDVFVRELCRLSYSAIQQSQRNEARF